MSIDYGRFSSELTIPFIKEVFGEVNDRNSGKLETLSKFATPNSAAHRYCEDSSIVDIPLFKDNPFYRDVMSIIFSKSFKRLADKTQAITSPVNSHITSRSDHVTRVAAVSETIARSIGANVDLTRAIALGHDIGHSFLGHVGEAYLTRGIYDLGFLPDLGAFKHNIQGVNVVTRMENRSGFDSGGLNLTSQVLHGIVSHDGEVYRSLISPNRQLRPEDLLIDINNYKERIIAASSSIELSDEIDDKELISEYRDEVLTAVSAATISPATLEACIVFIADVLTYCPEDFEDFVSVGVMKRGDLPSEIVKRFGSHGEDIRNELIKDVILHSYEQDNISYSEEVAVLLNMFKKQVLYPRYYEINEWIYSDVKDPRSGMPDGSVKKRVDYLFNLYIDALKNPSRFSDTFIIKNFLEGRDLDYYRSQFSKSIRNSGALNAAIALDCISGFSDATFMRESEGAFA